MVSAATVLYIPVTIISDPASSEVLNVIHLISPGSHHEYPKGHSNSVKARDLNKLLYVFSHSHNLLLWLYKMAMYYAVEFPSEDAKSKGPYVVPENKVKVEKGQTQVLWTVVNENGDLMEEYFEATNLKKGSKRDCGEFIDRLKESREKADISNKEGRCRKKPSKLNDYENPENLNSASNAPPLKKPRKTLIDEAWNDFRTNSVDELDEDDIEELDGNEVLVRWEEKVAKKRTNGFSRQNKNKERSQSRSGSKPKKANKPLRAAESKVKNAVKKARDETVFSQSSEIGKSLALEMRVVHHGLNGSEPVEFKISFSRLSTFGMLRKQLSQMTGILPADQLIIIKGEEWVMEDREVITEVWSPEDLVAVSDKGTKLDGKDWLKLGWN